MEKMLQSRWAHALNQVEMSRRKLLTFNFHVFSVIRNSDALKNHQNHLQFIESHLIFHSNFLPFQPSPCILQFVSINFKFQKLELFNSSSNHRLLNQVMYSMENWSKIEIYKSLFSFVKIQIKHFSISALVWRRRRHLEMSDFSLLQSWILDFMKRWQWIFAE